MTMSSWVSNTCPVGNGAQSGSSVLAGSTGATVGSGGGAVVVSGGTVVVGGAVVVSGGRVVFGGGAVVVSGGTVVVGGGGEVVVIKVEGVSWSDDVIACIDVLEVPSAEDVRLNPGGKPVTMVPVTASAG